MSTPRIAHAARGRRSGPARRPRQQRRKKEPMLPPAIPVELPPEGSGDETLRQQRLKEFALLEKQYLDIRARYQAAYLRLQNSVIEGAAIQPGAYKIESKLYNQRHPRYRQAVIDLKGEDFQRRILEGTVPTAHLRVRVH